MLIVRGIIATGRRQFRALSLVSYPSIEVPHVQKPEIEQVVQVETPNSGDPLVLEAGAVLPVIQLGAAEAARVTIIEPSHGWVSLKLREVWQYRDLLFFLAWRDISVRYKQTVLGATWAIIQPFFSMVVFSLFFGRLARNPI